MKELNCKIAQNGFTTGPVFLLKKAEKLPFTAGKGFEEELKLFEKAVSDLLSELKNQASASGAENAKILEADMMILKDEEFSSPIISVLQKENASLPYAIQEGSETLALKLESGDSEYIRQRAADIRGLAQRMIDILLNRKAGTLSLPSVVVAEELTPGGFAELDQNNILGLITVKGSVTSHVSIMAGNLGIPYVCGIESLSEFSDGCSVIIDTAAGTITVDPDRETKKAAQDKFTALLEERKKAEEAAANVPLKTKIYANISNANNLDALAKSGAEGIGLFRSEFLFLDRSTAPDEEEQYLAYKAVLEAMGKKEVIIRTMDIGSDKKVSWLNIPDEKNPALGNRGFRLSYLNPALLRSQLRALLRAAVCGNLKIMVPMITSEWEVDEFRKTAQAVEEELKKDGIACRIPPIGIMIETPAAAVIADRLAEKADFFSIGTNDLTQYTIALDRESEGLDEFYAPHHEALTRLIRMTVEGARKTGIPVAVCGELGSDPEMIPVLVEAGVDELSVSPAKINQVRALVAKAEKELFYNFSSPCDGQMLAMEEIGDPVFASGMMGRAVGIIPTDSVVYAPIDGKLIALADTKHAFTIEDKEGKQMLVHVGIDTVKLNGEGFEALVKKDEDVKAGQAVLKVDFENIRKKGLDSTVIVVLPDGKGN